MDDGHRECAPQSGLKAALSGTLDRASILVDSDCRSSSLTPLYQSSTSSIIIVLVIITIGFALNKARLHRSTCSQSLSSPCEHPPEPRPEGVVEGRKDEVEEGRKEGVEGGEDV